MASDQTPAILVARFLKAHHYNQTLDAFLIEANLTERSAVSDPGDWTLEALIREKIQFDTSLNYEKRVDQAEHGWSKPAPSRPTEPGLPVSTNVLSVNKASDSSLVISTANNACGFVGTTRPYNNQGDISFKADSPILSTNALTKQHLAATTMSGKFLIYDFVGCRMVTERRDHGKWAVNIASHSLPGEQGSLVATAGWDQKVHIYTIDTSSLLESDSFDIPPVTHTISLPSNPESLVFVTNPDTSRLYLVLSRRDSSFLYYYRVNTSPTLTITSAGRQNLAPHSNAWVAFTPSTLALHPTDPTLLAIATSHLPHLKVMVVRLLFPDTPSTSGFTQSTQPQTPAALARADLALQDREDAAITLQVSTMAPQTPYSTPQICWRPDGSGVWVNGDDGVVRGVEAKTGKVVALLQAHEAGSKVRTLWAGYLGKSDADDDGGKREVIVSGGFDRKVFIWEVDKGEQTENDPTV